MKIVHKWLHLVFVIQYQWRRAAQRRCRWIEAGTQRRNAIMQLSWFVNLCLCVSEKTVTSENEHCESCFFIWYGCWNWTTSSIPYWFSVAIIRWNPQCTRCRKHKEMWHNSDFLKHKNIRPYREQHQYTGCKIRRVISVTRHKLFKT